MNLNNIDYLLVKEIELFCTTNKLDYIKFIEKILKEGLTKYSVPLLNKQEESKNEPIIERKIVNEQQPIIKSDKKNIYGNW